MVGDHPLDVETARRAGTLSGAVASGRIGLEELSLAMPDFAAEDCPELLRQLGLFGPGHPAGVANPGENG